jgi:hypothetical protein
MLKEIIIAGQEIAVLVVKRYASFISEEHLPLGPIDVRTMHKPGEQL